MGRKFEESVNIIWHQKKYWGFLPWTFTHYYVVEKPEEWKKLICVKGFINKTESEIHLYRITDATYNRRFKHIFFGTGNVTVLGDEGKQQTVEVLENIKKAQLAKDFITDLVEKERKARGIKTTEMH